MVVEPARHKATRRVSGRRHARHPAGSIPACRKHLATALSCRCYHPPTQTDKGAALRHHTHAQELASSRSLGRGWAALLLFLLTMLAHAACRAEEPYPLFGPPAQEPAR